MTLFLIGLFAFAGSVLLLFAEHRGMYFRLFFQYYFTPRIGERMNIIKTGYDENGQIAILEGVGLDKIYALSCTHLPGKSAAGTEDVFVYRQKFPTSQSIYRYGSMETELLSVGREVDNSVTVVKGAKRISSDSEWRSVNFIVHMLNLLVYACLALCVIILFVFLLTHSSTSSVMMAIFGALALVLKLLFKAERHGPALRIYSDVAPTQNKMQDDFFVDAAKRMGLDDNERRAFLREKERREIFEKMNPLFNKFYAELRASVENPPLPPAQNEVLVSAVKTEMNRVCFSSTAHPQTKAEAVLEKKRRAEVNTKNDKEEHIVFEEVDENQVKRPQKEAIAHDIKTIILEDSSIVLEAADLQRSLPADGSPPKETGACSLGGCDSNTPPSKEDLSDVARGNKAICTTCGCVCNAPNSSNWTKMKCPDCGASIRRSRI